MSIQDAVIMVVFIEAFLHYASRSELWGGKQLPRPAAYVLGTLGMTGPFTAWLIGSGQYETATVLWWILCTGGAVVLLTYLLDWVHGLVVSLRETREREALLQAQLDRGGCAEK